ncbi:MAG TPA: hypothetical protein PKX79_05595 [Spirochaetota bacterium]|nr:hypothetical protein [Spirochaetota bacterium]HPP94836.1 hypothetical protein [Spirochaetota bacterium]
MDETIVTLYTGEHCIETSAKNEFKSLTEKLLTCDDEKECEVLGAKLELLRNFLENSNFNELRSSDERLAGIIPGYCIIHRDQKGDATIKLIETIKTR